MNIRVKIDDQWVEVEVGELHSRPVIAVIDGETFQVWPEAERVLKLVPQPSTLVETSQPGSIRSDRIPRGGPPMPTHLIPQVVVNRKNGDQAPETEKRAAIHPQDILHTVRAPLPGVILSIAVKTHDVVRIGQELCVLEAMKMKNSIRANRAGEIAEIHIIPGQHVKAHEVLIEFVR